MARLEITRDLSATPERVWHALTDPAALAAWFWPHLDNTVETDPRVGGRYRIAGPRAGIAVTGEYLEVDPPRRLVFTWRWEDQDEQSRVTVELRPAGTGTTLTLVHDRIGDAVTRDRFADGWRDCLDRLATLPL
ncbi:MAG TPA: SRPBCC domain-containing protein [Natronosporangium sp.]|nr:SRPBCC domain-containing protein [Natronosporangium sp.]